MKVPIKRIITITVAIALLIYALRGVSFAAISQEFVQANYSWILIVFVTTIGSYIVRGKRSQQSLIALGYKPTTFRSTIALMSGNIASMIVPGAGEITRCMTLNRTDGIPISHSMGAVIGERVLDLLMLLFIMVLTFLVEFKRASSFFTSLSFAPEDSLIYMIIILAFLLITGMVFYQLFRERWSKYPILLRIRGGVLGLWHGLMAIKSLPNPGLFVFLAFLNQFLYWASTYGLLQALPDTYVLPTNAALTVLTVSSLGGLAVPTQGGIGTYHFLVSRALVLYGFTTVEGALAATFMHTVGFGINIILSGISFLIVPFLISQRQKTNEPVSES